MPPEQCVVIEDAIAGIEAAKRAGMRAIAVTTTHPPERFLHADYIVPSLAALRPGDLCPE